MPAGGVESGNRRIFVVVGSGNFCKLEVPFVAVLMKRALLSWLLCEGA